MTLAEKLAQKQLDAYNNKQLEDFISVYSEDVVVMDFPTNEVKLSGMKDFKKRYDDLFKNNPNQHAELKGRIVKENTVIDHEYITGRANGITSEAIAIYEITGDKITKVWFVK
ncbi:nuclear transport factor 2 family protein [Fredinandcohnia sp. 179-A 10B2 NHS]|uniref:nuclear transport factor 2 family protein n=1 Tax=Fredinandcohnia sp. 179-A 10B2 NHS TaxID=3235176 RepID=UPI00399EE9DA